MKEVGIGVLNIDPGDERDDRDGDHRTGHGVIPHVSADVAPQNVQGIHHVTVTRRVVARIALQDELGMRLRDDMQRRIFITAGANDRRWPDARMEIGAHGGWHDHH